LKQVFGLLKHPDNIIDGSVSRRANCA